MTVSWTEWGMKVVVHAAAALGWTIVLVTRAMRLRRTMLVSWAVDWRMLRWTTRGETMVLVVL